MPRGGTSTPLVSVLIDKYEAERFSTKRPSRGRISSVCCAEGRYEVRYE